MTDDVEKRWSDTGTFRHAARYGLAVIALAAVVCAGASIWASSGPCRDADALLCERSAQMAVLLGPAAVLLAGGIGAFVQTIRVWRRRGAWPVWQGAGWFLFLIMLLFLGIGASTIPAD